MSGANLLQGYDLVNGNKVVQPYRRTVAARAGAAITVAVPVRVDTSTPLGVGVIACNSTYDHAILGFYEGIGGSGASTTLAAYHGQGYAAVTGDQVEVLVEGPTKTLGRMTATNANTLAATQIGVALGCASVDYQFNIVSALAAGIKAQVLLHSAGAITDGTTAEAIAVYVL